MWEKKAVLREKKNEAKQRILEAAEHLFFQMKGYDKTTIRDIAEMADVSTGTVYNHFPSKFDLLAVIIEQFFSIHEQGAEMILKTAETGIEKIKTYIDYVSQLLEHPKSKAFLQYMMRIEPEDIDIDLLSSLQHRANQLRINITEMIRIGHVDGTIARSGPPELMAFIFMHLLQGFFRDITGTALAQTRIGHMALLMPSFTIEEIIDQLKHMLVAALQTKTSPA